MAVSFTRLSWWLWSSKEKEPVSTSTGSSLNSSQQQQQQESLRFSSVKGTKITSSSSRKVKRKWPSREDRKIDREYDVVLVPSDGVCLSGSESDDSDWSIGWLEPHGPGFRTDDDDDDKFDNSFAVLVPCYSPGCKEVLEGSNIELLTAIKNLPNEFSPEGGRNYMEQWLSSLQNFES